MSLNQVKCSSTRRYVNIAFVVALFIFMCTTGLQMTEYGSSYGFLEGIIDSALDFIGSLSDEEVPDIYYPFFGRGVSSVVFYVPMILMVTLLVISFVDCMINCSHIRILAPVIFGCNLMILIVAANMAGREWFGPSYMAVYVIPTVLSGVWIYVNSQLQQSDASARTTATATQPPAIPPAPAAMPSTVIENAQEVKIESPARDVDDILEQLRRLAALREQGALSAEEYDTLKRRILAD